MDGYTRIPNDILRSPLLTPVEKVVWLLIASNQPGFAISTRTACAALGISNKTWYKAVDQLARRGLIQATRNGAGKVNAYTAILEPSKWGTGQQADVEFLHNQVVENLHNNCGKITQPNVENLHNQMCKNSTTIKEQGKEQENISRDSRDAHACVRERFRRLVLASDIKAGQLMKKFRIPDRETYLQIAAEILDDWDLAELTADRIDWAHFTNTFRIKAQARRSGETPLERRERAGREAVLETAEKIKQHLNNNRK